MPTWSCSMSGGSCAPMENSPPGIHTMPGSALPGESVLLGTVGAKGTPADIIAAGLARCAAIELTGDGAGTTTATVRAGGSLQRLMPTTTMMHRVARVQGSTLCGVRLAAFQRLFAFRIKILRQRLRIVLVTRADCGMIGLS